MGSLSFESAYSDDAIAIGEWERVFLLIWRGRPTQERLERAVAAAHAVSARLPGPLSMLAVIEHGSPPPPLPTMMYSARAFDGMHGVLVASVAVLESRTAASAVLDALGRVNALRRNPTPSRFCADVREAATWLATRHPHARADFREGLVDAVEELRARLPAVPS